MNDTPEIDLMHRVDVHPWGPTEEDEVAVLNRLFSPHPTVVGGYTFRVGSLVPNTVAASLNESNKWIGVSGRPNVFTREYASRHGSGFLTAAWCDMFQTYVARHAPAPAMIPNGDRAYTPWHAHDFTLLNRSYAGTAANVRDKAVSGALIFFDWNGSNDEDDVDHVGRVVKNLGDGRVVTIEGNTGDTVKLRTRGADVIARICAPAYATEPKPPAKPVPDRWPYKAGVLMRKGWINSAGVEKVQARINALGYRPKLIVDSDFGSKTEAAVMWAQRKFKIGVDGIVGPETWGKLFA